MQNIKKWLSIAAFVAALIMGFIAMFLPPTGIIDSSVLWFTSQCLVFTAGILGINLNFNNGTAVTNKK